MVAENRIGRETFVPVISGPIGVVDFGIAIGRAGATRGFHVVHQGEILRVEIHEGMEGRRAIKP